MISREEFWRLFRFGLVGGGATLVDLGISSVLVHVWTLTVLLQVGFVSSGDVSSSHALPIRPEFVISTAAFFVAFWFSFFGHRYITFQKHGAVGKFLMVALFSLLVRYVLLFCMTSLLGMAGLIPILIATLSVTILTFILSRTLVFV